VASAGAEWKRWKGTPEGVARIGRTALDTITSWSGDEDEPTKLAISVSLQPSLGLPLKSFEELERLDRSDVERVQTISIKIGRPYGDDPGVSIDFKNAWASEAVELSVHSPERERTEGLRKRLSEQVDQGRRRPGWYSRTALVVAAAIPVNVAFFGALLALVALDISLVLRIACALGLILLVGGLCAYAWWVTPTLELLSPGERTRWQRSSKLFIGAVLAIATLGGTALAAGRGLVKKARPLPDRPKPVREAGEHSERTAA
jgi:hypothetical protein